MKCQKCKSENVVEFETKHVKKGYFCHDCDNEWVVK